MIVYPDRICSSMANAAMVAYIAKHGYRENSGIIYAYEEGKEEDIIEK